MKDLRWKAFALSTVNLLKPNSLKESAIKPQYTEKHYKVVKCMHARTHTCRHVHTHIHTHTHTHREFTYLPLLHPGVKNNCTALSVDHLLVCVIINGCANERCGGGERGRGGRERRKRGGWRGKETREENGCARMPRPLTVLMGPSTW